MEVVEKSNNYQTTTKTVLFNNIDLLNNTVLLNNTNNGADVEILASVQKSLKNIVAKEGFTLHKITKRMISTNGNNYLGDLYEIDIKGETKDGPKEIHIFLKHVIPGDAIKSLIDVNVCYSREIFFYTELSHVFNRLQEDANVPDEERFNVVKNYECNPDAIMLENLAKKGFKCLFRMDVMPLKFAELSIAQLAKLHGLSFVLKHKSKDYFESKIKNFKTPLNFDVNTWTPMAKRQFEYSITYFDSDTQKKIYDFLENKFIEEFPKYFAGITGSVKCMCHGDFKISNVMVKGNAEEDPEIAVIDYQFPFYGSPVGDILYFIYTGSDGKFRKAHMNNLKDLYHKELTKFLMYFDLDINDVYPKKVYEKDFQDLLDYGLMVALYISPIIFTAEDYYPDFSKENLDSFSYKLDGRHKERITEIVEEYLEWGILN